MFSIFQYLPPLIFKTISCKSDKLKWILWATAAFLMKMQSSNTIFTKYISWLFLSLTPEITNYTNNIASSKYCCFWSRCSGNQEISKSINSLVVFHGLLFFYLFWLTCHFKVNPLIITVYKDFFFKFKIYVWKSCDEHWE